MAVPKLRFKEFDCDWKSVSLLDISALVTKGTTPKQFINGDVNFLKIEAITQSGFDLSKCQTINSEIHNKELKRSILKEGDILFAIAGATIGKNASVQKELLPVNTNQALAIIRLKENYSKVFISKVLNSPLMEKYIDINISTGAQPNLNLQQIGSFSFTLPNLEEQTKIASFLSAVDEKISQLSQKHQLLSQYKQGMMQKLFSQQIRFKADDGSEFGEWEEKIIGEIANIKRGASPRPITDTKWFDEDSKVGWVRISDVSKSKKVLVETEQYLSIAGIKKSRFIPKGNIIMSICATIGKPIYTGFDVCIHDGFVVFSELKAWHEYTYYYLEYIEKNWYQYGQPGTQVNLNSDIVSNEIFPFPCLEEQTKIANFLSAIDQKIEVVAQQIEQAKQWKKGLLQQMFI